MDAVPQRAVFLDRDGVLNAAIIDNGKPLSPASVSEIRIPVGVPEGCRELVRLGFLLIVVTNQPDIARGRLEPDALASIHSYLSSQLPLHDIYTCPHDDQDMCDCRKPAPGMLLAAGRRYHVDLRASWMIGDRWKDIAAGHAAGCRTILLRDRPYADEPIIEANAEVRRFSDAVCVIALNENRTPLLQVGEDDSA